MARGKDEKGGFSRRSFLRGMRWAPLLFLPAPIRGICFPSVRHEQPGNRSASFPLADFRLTPLYPAKSPLEDVLARVVPGSDEYVTEKYAFEIMRHLTEWSEALKASPPALAVVAKFLDASIEATTLIPVQEKTLRSGNGIDVLRSRFSLILVLRLWAKLSHTEIRCSTEWIFGALLWTERAESTSMGTTVWPQEILMEMDWMISMCASPRGFPTGSIATAAMGRSRM